MAIIFSPDSLGKAAAFSVSGAVPFITMDVDPGLDTESAVDPQGWEMIPGGSLTGINSYRDLKEGAGFQYDKIMSFWKKVYYDVHGKLGGKAAANAYAASQIRRRRAINLDERRDLERRLNATHDPDERLHYSSILRNTARSEMSLLQSLAGVGILTSITCSFSDIADVQKIAGNSAPKSDPGYGTASIGGLVFERSCDSSSNRLSTGRHGLERLLEYYYWNRLSNTTAKASPNTISFTIGATKLRGYITGFSFQPVQPNFRLWGWTISMMVSSNYWVESLGLGD